RRFLFCIILPQRGNRRFPLRILAMLFEKLVEQHRVHHFIVDALSLALNVARYQGWVDLGHILSDQAEGGRLASVDLFLVTVCDWFKPVELFTDIVHWFDVVLVTSGRTQMPKLARRQVHSDSVGATAAYGRGVNIADISLVALASNAQHFSANVDVTRTRCC